MNSFKPLFRLISIVGGAAYCGYLVYYFVDTSGSLENLQTNGLGPTVLGLSIVGLIFFIILLVLVVKLFTGARASRAGGSGGSGPSSPEPEFDADAVVARYLAKQSAEAASAHAASPRTQDGTKRSTFGRKSK